MTEDIEKYEARHPETKEVAVSPGPQAIILKAMDKNYTPEQVEKMLELQMKWEANEARKAYFEAVAAFKAEAPQVKKDKHNKFFDSWYTSLGNLLDTYNPILGKHGLSVSHKPPEQTEKSMTVECILAHRMGHTESVKMTMPIDEAAIGRTSGQRSRTPIQDIKTTFTYLRSVTLEAILGVSGTEGTNGTDNDGNTGEPEFITEKQLSSILDMINSKNLDEAPLLKYLGVESFETILAKDFDKAISVLKKAKAMPKKPPERVPGEEG